MANDRRSLSDRIRFARRRPDFEAWRAGMRLVRDRDRPDADRIASDAGDLEAIRVALEELALALAGSESDRSNLDHLSRAVLIAQDIAQGHRDHRQAAAIREQFDYFERHLRHGADLSLGFIADGWPTQKVEAKADLLFDVVYELVRNLWSWLHGRAQLPLITEARIDGLIAEGRQHLDTAKDPVAAIREVVSILHQRVDPEAGSELAVELLSRHPDDPAAMALQAEFGDPWAALAASDHIVAAGRAREPAMADLRLYAVADLPVAEAKALIFDRWDTLVSDGRRLSVGLSLPWTLAEKQRIAEKLVEIAPRSRLPRVSLEIAACRLMAWGHDTAAAALVEHGGPIEGSGVGLMIRLLRDGTIPPLADPAEGAAFDDRPVIHHRVEGSDSAIVFFAGINDLPIEAFHRIFAPLGAHVLYLKDRSRLLSLGGIAPLGETYGETIVALRRFFAREGLTRLHMIGRSGGGLAAIRYGVDLGALTVQGFGAATNITEAFLRNDRRGNSIARRLRAIVPEAEQDLRAVVEAAAHPPHIVLSYPQHYDADVRHADNFRGLPTVEFVEYPGATEHDSFMLAMAAGDFVPRMKRFLDWTASDVPPPAST